MVRDQMSLCGDFAIRSAGSGIRSRRGSGLEGEEAAAESGEACFSDSGPDSVSGH